jgi:hypothetical protein
MQGGKVCVQVVEENELLCYDKRSTEWKSFVFDKCWEQTAKQDEVFVDIEPLALSVVDGFNVSIIAYGQTGSGKTYTMNGIESEPGISYRTMNKIFQLLEYKKMQEKYGPPKFQSSSLSASDSGAEATVPENDLSTETERPEFLYTIQVSMLEIYNEQVKYTNDYILFKRKKSIERFYNTGE